MQVTQSAWPGRSGTSVSGSMAFLNVYRAPNGYLLSPEKRTHQPPTNCMWLGVMAAGRFSEGVQQQIHEGLQSGRFAVLTHEQFHDQQPESHPRAH